MKDFIIGFFRDHPCLTGLLLILVGYHFIGAKSFTASWRVMPEEWVILIIGYLAVFLAYILWILPYIAIENREKLTWVFVFSYVAVALCVAMFFIV
jgi:uncharacterized membrane protein YidH (DUF202 family)